MVEKIFRVIIAGSRDFNDYGLLRLKMDYFLSCINKDIVILCGMAKGADLLGKKYAKAKGYKVLEYPAQWNVYGKKAGYLRNVEMAKNADALVAFWDGKSRGTKNMIEIAESHGLMKRVVMYDSG